MAGMLNKIDRNKGYTTEKIGKKRRWRRESREEMKEAAEAAERRPKHR
jgi:hypothetical protein